MTMYNVHKVWFWKITPILFIFRKYNLHLTEQTIKQGKRPNLNEVDIIGTTSEMEWGNSFCVQVIEQRLVDQGNSIQE
jgi:hypothetical protein